MQFATRCAHQICRDPAGITSICCAAQGQRTQVTARKRVSGVAITGLAFREAGRRSPRASPRRRLIVAASRIDHLEALKPTQFDQRPKTERCYSWTPPPRTGAIPVISEPSDGGAVCPRVRSGAQPFWGISVEQANHDANGR
jgi:hypothetical protein